MTSREYDHMENGWIFAVALAGIYKSPIGDNFFLRLAEKGLRRAEAMRGRSHHTVVHPRVHPIGGRYRRKLKASPRGPLRQAPRCTLRQGPSGGITRP